MRSAVALAVLALVGAPVRGGEAPPSPAPGPRATSIAAEEVVAHDESELARLLADPGGPRAIRLEPHAYVGDVRIARSVRVRGVPGTVLQGSGSGTVVTIDGDAIELEDVAIRGSGDRYTAQDAGVRASGHDVHVRDVSIDGTLFGILFYKCPASSIERVHVIGRDDIVGMRGDAIKVWESDDALVKDSLVERSRDVVVWYTRRAVVEGLHVIDSRYGTHFMYAHDCVVRRSRYERDIVGVFVMYSSHMRVESSVSAGARGAAGMGIGFKDTDDVELEGNWLVANTAGVYFDHSPRSPEQPIRLRGNVLALNQIGLHLHSSEKGVAVRDCDFRENLSDAQVDGGGDALGLDVEGNHWTQYAGYDLDGDGRGDVPFQIKKLSSDVKETHPDLHLFDGSFVMGLLDTIAEATPIFASRLMLVDDSPRMRAPTREAP